MVYAVDTMIIYTIMTALMIEGVIPLPSFPHTLTPFPKLLLHTNNTDTMALIGTGGPVSCDAAKVRYGAGERPQYPGYPLPLRCAL